jgi:hypothetical protein
LVAVTHLPELTELQLPESQEVSGMVFVPFEVIMT